VPRRPTAPQIDSFLNAIITDIALEVTRLSSRNRDWAADADAALRAVKAARLPTESLAGHCWHVADAVLLVGPVAFPGEFDLERAVTLSILHDKYTGGWDVVGEEGTTTFDFDHQDGQAAANIAAARSYLVHLPLSAIKPQLDLLAEMAENRSREARLVSAVDRLQGVISVMVRTRGDMSDDHIRFALSYSTPAAGLCPEVAPFITAAHRRLCQVVGTAREVDGTELYDQFAFELLAQAA
jgi:5'-deoxynucleotidase YfbR-like HD superfamily hydrolase